MKILHIAMGTPEFDRAALDLGHDVQRIAWREILGRKYAPHAPELQPVILRTARKFRPDLVFVQTHQSEVVAAATYDTLRAEGAFVVNWCGDVRDPLPECYVRYSDHVDVMAFSNLTDVEELRARGSRSEYLQIGYDPEIYFSTSFPRSGIVFMGNHYAGRFPNTDLRKEVAVRLSEEFPGQFALYGSGWGMPGVRPTVNAQEEADLYRRALVAINVDHFTRPLFASDRLLRATACGCATVSMSYPGIESEHPTVGAARTVDELVAMVRHALNSPEEARKVGEMSAANTLEHHTWHKRIQTMQQWVEQR